MLTFLITQRKNKRIRNPQESCKPYCFEKYISALKKYTEHMGKKIIYTFSNCQYFKITVVPKLLIRSLLKLGMKDLI